MKDQTVYQIVSEILKQMAEMAQVGVSTMQINNKAEDLVKEYGCTSYNKGYQPDGMAKPFPTVMCINRNHVIAHGVPSEEKLEDGDIVSLDLGILKGGKCADAALSVAVGNITNEKKRLLYYSYQTMMAGINALKPGADTENIARVIEGYALQRGFKINRRFAGHRIDNEMHMKPNIYNTTEPSHKYAEIKEGDIYCVEPMLTSGNDSMGRMAPDGFSFITLDGKPSAFFEHMVRVGKDGPEILTDHITPPTL